MKARHTHAVTPRAHVAPVHRGPQAMSHTGLGNPPHAPNAALMIDFDNVTMGIRSDLQTELRNLLSSDIIQGKVAVQRAYADWRRYPQYVVPLAEASIDMIMAPAYGSSKKNATDIRLSVDAMELVFTRPEIGTYILLSGDSDFSSLVTKLKEYGKYVIGVGIRESSSDLLVQNCDEYYSYNALAGLVKSGEEEPERKWDPWQLVTEAINRMEANHDVMRSDRLKQVMQEIDSNFDEKDLGMAKFSKFCLEASHKGLLKVTKLENGQLEVAPPEAKSSRAERGAGRARPAEAHAADAPAPEAAGEVAAAEPAPEAPAGEREGRSRRGRRGGRGRKRGERSSAAESGELALGEAVESVPSVEDETLRVPVAAPVAVPVATPSRQADTDDSIGVSGVRLTRDEAMNLLRRAVEVATADEESVSDEVVRRTAFEVLGRDSESLSARNFGRILRDAHDGDIVDLRRRGDGFEVARAAAAASVADQLAEREQEARAAEPAAPAAPPAPRGMGPRSAPAGRGGRGGRGAARTPPPDGLLMVGVVDQKSNGAE